MVYTRAFNRWQKQVVRMKIRYLVGSLAGRAAVILLTSSLNNFAQTATSNSVPTVTIQATDPWATWAGDTGTFTIFRTGNPEPALNVYCCISGSASNGVDYKSIGNFVQLASGVMSNFVTIDPIDLGQTNVKTVTLELCPSPLMSPINYSTGSPDHATVYIMPTGQTNIPPFVRIVAPTNGATFFGQVDCPPCLTNNPPCALPCYFDSPDIVICADAGDPDGYVATVEFFANGVSLGTRTNCPACANPVNPFCLLWTNAPPGIYSVTAVVKDNFGATNTSDPVSITVSNAPSPQTHLLPVAQMVSPTNGSVFYGAPVDIGLIAKADDAYGYVTNVEFFAGIVDLGRGQPLALDPPGINGIVGLIYFLSWTNVSAGTYSVTAVASDNFGATNVSDTVGITVSNGPPPPHTNLAPIVRIISPPNGSLFHSPIDLPLFAYAHDPDGTVNSVEFIADGTNSLGLGHIVKAMPPPSGPVPLPFPIIASNVWELTWSNASIGIHVLSAAATDNSNAVSRAAHIFVTILPLPPPPTNRPPIISIVASDPVAIEGTNCWPWLGLTTANPTWSVWDTNHVYQFFTNCGPKNATFVVRRRGDTNDALTVAYAIGGSATNGVDYVPLSGTVTIPAGERSAMINIVPVDDGPPDISSTVVLTLLADTNTPAEYVLGLPRRAATLILDGPQPRPLTGILPDKRFHLAASGPDGAWFHVEYSTDLANWISICTNQVVNGSIDFIDPDAANGGSHFYRALPENGPPTE